MLSFYFFSLFFSSSLKMLSRKDLSTAGLPPLGKRAVHFLFCTFFCFNQCTDLPFYITSVRAFQTLSDAFRKSKPTASSRSLLPICLETPSKSSSRLGKRLGSSPKNSDFSMCQVLLLGQMLGLGDYRGLWIPSKSHFHPQGHTEVLGEAHLVPWSMRVPS